MARFAAEKTHEYNRKNPRMGPLAAAESMAMLPFDGDEELETAYDTDCQRVAVRIARAWPAGNSGGLTTLFHLLAADKEDRARK